LGARVALEAVGAGLMAMGGVLAVPAAIFKTRALWRRSSRWSAILGLLSCVAAAAVQWQGLGRPPVREVSESLLLLAPGLALGYLLIEGLSKSREGGLPILLAAAGMALVTATTLAGYGPLYPDPLPPELASPWLAAYAVVTLLAYGLLGAGSVQAVAFLVVERFSPARGERAGRGAFWAVCLGFPLLVWSLLIAAVIAADSRGSLWSWGARETWTLVYTLVLTAYLCLRYVGHWPERRATWLLALSLGLWAVAFLQACRLSGG